MHLGHRDEGKELAQHRPDDHVLDDHVKASLQVDRGHRERRPVAQQQLAQLKLELSKLEKSKPGIVYGILNGVLSGVGGLALFAAYHTNGNTTLITATTALYPMITVVLAITILREQFRPIQAVGLLFAAIAIVIFSL